MITSIRHMQCKLKKTKHEWICVPTSCIFALGYVVFMPVYTCVYFFDWILYALLYMFKRRHHAYVNFLRLVHPCFPPLNTLWYSNLRTLTEGDLDPSWILFLLTVGPQAVWGSYGSAQLILFLPYGGWPLPKVWGQQMIYFHLQMNVKA